MNCSNCPFMGCPECPYQGGSARDFWPLTWKNGSRKDPRVRLTPGAWPTPSKAELT